MGDALALAVDVGETAGVIGVGCELVVGVHADSTKAKNASTRMPVLMLRLSASLVPVSFNLCTESRVRRLRSFSSRPPSRVLFAFQGWASGVRVHSGLPEAHLASRGKALELTGDGLERLDAALSATQDQRTLHRR